MAKGACKCKHPACEECPEWIFTFADLVMLMMGFFVILWVLKPAPGKSDTEVDEKWLEAVARIREAFKYLPDPTSKDPVDMFMLMKKLEEMDPLKGKGDGGDTKRIPRGAVGTARFSGARLREVLERAGVKSTGKHVMFHGLDEVPGKVPPFIRSIPIEKAMDVDTLIATEMNGAALTKHHGYPARALVPGWIGAASCKWLAEIKVLEAVPV